jgi:G3E family GTPase
LLGEFEAAVTEIIKKVAPEIIIVETTGLAEPEALVSNIQEALPECRLDGVISVIDADMLVRFPELGHTTRLQIEAADILLLNKIDLVDAKQIEPLETKLRKINSGAAIIRTERCRIDPELLFGIGRERKATTLEPGSPIPATTHKHQPEFESFTFSSNKIFSRECFERFANGLPASVVRTKGFVRFPNGTQLFNFVAGRWELEPFESDETQLVFIGKAVSSEKEAIIDSLKKCQQ